MSQNVVFRTKIKLLAHLKYGTISYIGRVSDEKVRGKPTGMEFWKSTVAT